MKKTLFIVSSIVLSCIVSSCQKDEENFMNVNETLATTRTAVLEDNADIQKDEPLRSITISGDAIISGTEQKTYTVPSYNSTIYKMNWIYDSSAFTCVGGGGDNNYITISLTNPGRVANANLRAELLYKSNNTLNSADTKTIACNGPFAGTSSVRIVRSSDGVEVYPSSVGLSPNTFYYAYFSNTMASNMALQWEISNIDTNYFSSWGYTAYFKTNSVGYCYLTVKGKMPNSSVYKTMIDNITLFGGAK